MLLYTKQSNHHSAQPCVCALHLHLCPAIFHCTVWRHKFRGWKINTKAPLVRDNIIKILIRTRAANLREDRARSFKLPLPSFPTVPSKGLCFHSELNLISSDVSTAAVKYKVWIKIFIFQCMLMSFFLLFSWRGKLYGIIIGEFMDCVTKGDTLKTN